jgi:ATP-dependent protease ClpP protease subunit
MHPTILLNTTNHLALRGAVSEASASELVRAALTAAQTPSYLYLDTGGGDVMAGQRIIQLVVQLQLICIVFRAYSMGFAILQHCRHRWVLPGATLMQHPMSVTFSGPVRRSQEYVNMALRLSQSMNRVQAERLGVSVAWFLNRTASDWWMEDTQALQHRCADTHVHVTCTRALALRNVTRTEEVGLLAGVVIPGQQRVYSACPLVAQALE